VVDHVDDNTGEAALGKSGATVPHHDGELVTRRRLVVQLFEGRYNSCNDKYPRLVKLIVITLKTSKVYQEMLIVYIYISIFPCFMQMLPNNYWE